MSSFTMKPLMALRRERKEKDPLEIYGGVRIKQEIDELDNFKVAASTRNDSNKIVIKKEVTDSDLDNILHQSTTPGIQKVINVNNLSTKRKRVVKILPFNKKTQCRKEDSGRSINNKTVDIKKERPCKCMQNVEYYCKKCEKTLNHINEVKQCSVCNNQLKLQCRLCHKRYKLLRSIHPLSISTNIKKEIDIKDEEHFSCFQCSFKTTEKKLLDDHVIKNNHKNDSNTRPESINEGVLFCYKCEFSTKVKEQLNIHILKSHWQPKAEVINCNDDMYIELVCKKCQKMCRKVVYDNLVKLVCRECQVPMLYRCTLCRNDYKLLKNVRHHINCVCPYRINNEKFYCADCNFKTETKATLENHIVKRHLNQQCSNCHKTVEDNDDLREHELKHCVGKKSNIRPIKLELPCNEATEEDEKFIIIQHRPDDLVKGISCKPPRNTKDWGSLVDYLCLKCGDEAKKKFARYRPWCRKCNLKYDYRCISCEKLYGNYDRIHHHVKFRCPNRMVFECPLCRYNASNKSILSNHIQTFHTIYKCMECFNNVEGSLTLKKHQTTECYKDLPHTAAQLEKLINFYCKQCQKIPRKIVNTARAKCEKCAIILNYQCLKCLNVLDSRDFAYKHIKESCKPKFHCERCTFKTYTQVGLDTHTKYKHMNRMCLDCGVCFKDELIFQLHRREEMRRKRYNLGVFPAANPKRLKVF